MHCYCFCLVTDIFKWNFDGLINFGEFIETKRATTTFSLFFCRKIWLKQIWARSFKRFLFDIAFPSFSIYIKLLKLFLLNYSTFCSKKIFKTIWQYNWITNTILVMIPRIYSLSIFDEKWALRIIFRIILHL